MQIPKLPFMKTKFTINTFALCIFISTVAILSSCSVSNQLSSQNPRYHLDLVKTNIHPLPTDKKENENTASDIAPMPQHGSLVSYRSDELLNGLNSLLKTDMKLLTKEAKKSSPGIYQQINTISLNKTLHQVIKNNSGISSNKKSSVNNTNSMGHSSGYFGLFILFLLLALLFWILSIGAGLFGILAFISSIAAVIFFILWIVSFMS
jgi:hypothetical protein